MRELYYYQFEPEFWFREIYIDSSEPITEAAFIAAVGHKERLCTVNWDWLLYSNPVYHRFEGGIIPVGGHVLIVRTPKPGPLPPNRPSVPREEIEALYARVRQPSPPVAVPVVAPRFPDREEQDAAPHQKVEKMREKHRPEPIRKHILSAVRMPPVRIQAHPVVTRWNHGYAGFGVRQTGMVRTGHGHPGEVIFNPRMPPPSAPHRSQYAHDNVTLKRERETAPDHLAPPPKQKYVKKQE
ncbi:hypothetical protein L596_000817 [Steinernema carpocapsae]|uniref:Uncharacterized protein n=1 Tax=Steinernema carpocapsae TaxID=34508 RepID=A0A4V6I6Y9_STECR|nr:hypothetical protein L596_000817 [Steinernema carpocapsae]